MDSLKSPHFVLGNYKNIEVSYVFSDAALGKIPEQKVSFIPLYYVEAALTSDVTND